MNFHDGMISVSADQPHCNIFKQLYQQIAFIDRMTQKNDFIKSGMINYLLIGFNFNILPFTSKFKQLISSNNQFRHDICCGEPNIFNTTYKYGISNWKMVSLILACGIFPPSMFIYEVPLGFLGFFMCTVIKGDFSIYLDFVNSNNSNSSTVDI